MKPGFLNIKVISPKQVLFEGQAESLSSKNSAGNFDILPEHANFITLVENQPIKIILADKKPVSFNFPIAIIYNYQNQVRIYTDITL